MKTRRRRNLVDAILANSASAVCVLDADRRVRFFSPGMQQQTQWPPEKVEGLVCELAVAPDAKPIDLLTSAIAPPAAVLQGHIHFADAILPLAGRGTIQTRICHLPVEDEEGVVSRVIVFSSVQPADSADTITSRQLSQSLHAEITALRLDFRNRFGITSVLGRDPAMQRAIEQAHLLKDADCGFTIIGPPGSGRRHLAKTIHVAGRHMEDAIVPLHCRLLSSEQLFTALRQLGKRRTADAGAAHHPVGTVLFVDADRMPREVQHWLLENLHTEAASIRLAATSEVPLLQPEQEGWILPEFRQLLSTVEIVLPSLHARGSDVLLLAQHFVENCHRLHNTSAESISETAAAELTAYRWPGNVRELKQVIYEACQTCFGERLEVSDLPFTFRVGMEAQRHPPAAPVAARSLEEILIRFESEVLQRTLEICNGNKAEAARRLGLTRPKLYRRLRTLGLESDEP
ncbi:MAG: helix-turn-helix domain-containing protein [Planctomycetaceae bacterium]